MSLFMLNSTGLRRAQFDGAIRGIVREQVQAAKKAGAIYVNNGEWLVDAISTQIDDLIGNMTEDLIECPAACGVTLPSDDLEGQRIHMETRHPAIIAERLADAARWDGWENDG